MKKSAGFSLIELLVALAILAIVSALIVPKFLNIGQSAEQIKALKNISELNSTYNQWSATGGQINGWIGGSWGASGSPTDINDLDDVPNVFGFLCQTGYSSQQSSYNYGQSSTGTSRATGKFCGSFGNMMVDSYGNGGSWTVVFSPDYVSPSTWNYEYMICEWSPGTMTNASSDGFYLGAVEGSSGYCLYYKAGKTAYLVHFEPAAVNGNTQTGFWININDTANNISY
jgi:prepilin-type N-terminal cleavage/methylation domain-containing protein